MQATRTSPILRASAFALTLVLGCMASAQAGGGGSVFSQSFDLVTESSGPLHFNFPDPEQGNSAVETLSNIRLLLSFSGQLTTLALRDVNQDCGCSWADASSTLSMSFAGPDFLDSQSQPTKASSGAIAPFTSRWVIQSDSIGGSLERDWGVPVPKGYLGINGYDLTVTPEVTTNGTGSGPALTLASTLSLSGKVTVVYIYSPLAPTPEPATWALASLGLAGLVAVRKRR